MIALFLASMLQAVEPAASAAQNEPPMVTRPLWVRRPSGEDLLRRYPKAAAAKQVRGVTATTCLITARGTLTDCVTLSEEPSGHGFAEASISLMSLFRMQPQEADGSRVQGRRIRIPVRWYLP